MLLTAETEQCQQHNTAKKKNIASDHGPNRSQPDVVGALGVPMQRHSEQAVTPVVGAGVVGTAEGTGLGAEVGDAVGAGVGAGVGDALGAKDGTAVGEGVGQTALSANEKSCV